MNSLVSAYYFTLHSKLDGELYFSVKTLHGLLVWLRDKHKWRLSLIVMQSKSKVSSKKESGTQTRMVLFEASIWCLWVGCDIHRGHFNLIWGGHGYCCCKQYEFWFIQICSPPMEPNQRQWWQKQFYNALKSRR